MPLKTIHILGQEFAIKYKRDKKKRDYIGKCFPNANKIYLVKDLSQDKLEETFIHEIIEAINFNLELKLKHRQITALAVAIYTVFKENNLQFKK